MKPKVKDLTGIEYLLKETLQPVPIRQEFVATLWEKLKKAEIIEENKRFPFGHVAVGIASVFSALILVVMGIRTLITFLAIIGVMRNMRKKEPSIEPVAA